jgi:phage terminase small subunit
LLVNLDTAEKETNGSNSFIAEYLQEMNATRAAIAVGYSKNGAEARSSEMLRNAKVFCTN